MSLEIKRELISSSLVSGAPSCISQGIFGRSVNLEEFIIVWLDADIGKVNNNDEHQAMLTSLYYIMNNVKTFNNVEDCIELIEEYTTEKIFFIVSGSYSVEIISRIHHLVQVVHIYIFCLHLDKYIKLWSTSEYTKIGERIFNKHKNLAESLKKDIFNSKKQLSTLEKFFRSLEDDPGSFIWFHLLLRSLIIPNISNYKSHIERNNKAKNDMVEQCRSYYQDNSFTLLQIDEFQGTYKSSEAIRWYTRDSFIYRILNRALRTENIDIIFLFRFFLVDLHKQISDLHKTYRKQLQDQGESKLIVYRGQFLKKEELENIEKIQGQLIAVNSYVSTTLDIMIAEIYAGNRSIDQESVIFKIEINIDQCNQPFANIQNYSYFNDENEILLSPGTLLRINSIEEQNHFSIISLHAIGEIFVPLEELYEFYDYVDMTECKFVNLLREMGDSHRANMYQRTLNFEYVDNFRKNEARLIFEERFDEINAETYFELSYYMCCGRPDHTVLVSNEKIFRYAESTKNWLLLANLFLEKGKFYLYDENFSIALSHFEQSLQIQLDKANEDSIIITQHYLITDTLYHIA